MATSIRDLVTRGMREAGILEVGGIPEAAELEECVDLLQSLYLSFFGNELGEQLTTVNYGKNGLVNQYAVDSDQSSLVDEIYVPLNTRLVLNIDSAKTLYFCPTPMDGARQAVVDNRDNVATYNVTISGNGRQVEGADSIVLNTNGVNREWFYRADLADWTKLTDLDPNDVSPLPREFDDFLSTALAFRINPRYGAQTGQELSTILERGRRQFRARYRQTVEVPSENALLYIPSNRWYWYNLYPSSNTAFSKGRF